MTIRKQIDLIEPHEARAAPPERKQKRMVPIDGDRGKPRGEEHPVVQVVKRAHHYLTI